MTGGHAGPAHEGDRRTMSMYADEESDEGIVPMKRSNNGSSLPAETVEGRRSTEGNIGPQVASRTQSRIGASFLPLGVRWSKLGSTPPRCALTLGTQSRSRMR